MRATHERVLQGIIVDVIDVMDQVRLVADAMLPEPLLPDPTLPVPLTCGGDGGFIVICDPSLGEMALDARPERAE